VARFARSEDRRNDEGQEERYGHDDSDDRLDVKVRNVWPQCFGHVT